MEELIKKCIKSCEWWKVEMLSKLMQRLHHGDWYIRSLLDIHQWLHKELKELDTEILNLEISKNGDECDAILEKIIDECRDVSNMCMMLADRCEDIMHRPACIMNQKNVLSTWRKENK